MGIFDNWILKRSEKIKDKQKAIKDEEHRQYVEEIEAGRKINQEARDILNKLVSEKEDEFNKQPCHIEVGQTAILNIYSLGRRGDNGWDGGPRSLINNLKQKPSKPVTVKITSIYTDTSLAQELIDRFLNYYSTELIQGYLREEVLERTYINWLNRRSLGSLGDLFGLYKTAHFDTDDEFKPRWGLNVDSFLPEGSNEYEETYQVWAQEIELYTNREMIDLRIKELEAEKRAIDEKYKGIKYGN